MALRHASFEMVDADGSEDSLESSLTEMDWLGRLNIEAGGLRGLIGGAGAATAAQDDGSDGRASHVTSAGLRANSKPPFSYTHLITSAINSCPARKMALSDIYRWISSRFPYYRHAAPGWKVCRTNCPSFPTDLFYTELSMGWVDPWVGLGRDFSVFGRLGWVGSTIAKVLKIERTMHLEHG